MNFRTEIILGKKDFNIDLAGRVFSTGSCFAENIADKLASFKFHVKTNPYGILFNPLSIVSMLKDLSECRVFTDEDLCYDGDLWFSWSHHGDFSDNVRDKVLNHINESVEHGAMALKEANCVIITFGTAWVYELASNGMVVANCHKQPSDRFIRRRMSVEEIRTLFEPFLGNGILKDKRVIFTVSPVRHLKDGFEENSLSKSLLRVAVGELAEQFCNVDYFPAYEIMNDDLRDYRFYAEDMAHPSQMAVDYIWKKFCDVYMSSETMQVMERINKITSAYNHRILKPQSASAHKFMDDNYKQTIALSREFPFIDFSEELDYFASNR